MVDMVPLSLSEPAAVEAPTGPLLTIAELSIWAQRDIDADDPFANSVIDAASMLVRLYGSANWTIESAPPRAKLIATLMARDYFKNPDRITSEGVGPLSERRIDDVARGMVVTDAEKAELAALAAGSPIVQPAGGGAELWSITTTRGVVEMDRGRPVGGTRYAYDSNGMLFPWSAIGDNLEPTQ